MYSTQEVDVASIRQVGGFLTGVKADPKIVLSQTMVSKMREAIDAMVRNQNPEAVFQRDKVYMASEKLAKAVVQKDKPAVKALLHILVSELGETMAEVITSVVGQLKSTS